MQLWKLLKRRRACSSLVCGVDCGDESHHQETTTTAATTTTKQGGTTTSITNGFRMFGGGRRSNKHKTSSNNTDSKKRSSSFLTDETNSLSTGSAESAPWKVENILLNGAPGESDWWEEEEDDDDESDIDNDIEDDISGYEVSCDGCCFLVFENNNNNNNNKTQEMKINNIDDRTKQRFRNVGLDTWIQVRQAWRSAGGMSNHHHSYDDDDDDQEENDNNDPVVAVNTPATTTNDISDENDANTSSQGGDKYAVQPQTLFPSLSVPTPPAAPSSLSAKRLFLKRSISSPSFGVPAAASSLSSPPSSSLSPSDRKKVYHALSKDRPCRFKKNVPLQELVRACADVWEQQHQ